MKFRELEKDLQQKLASAQSHTAQLINETNQLKSELSTLRDCQTRVITDLKEQHLAQVQELNSSQSIAMEKLNHTNDELKEKIR